MSMNFEFVVIYYELHIKITVILTYNFHHVICSYWDYAFYIYEVIFILRRYDCHIFILRIEMNQAVFLLFL